MKSIILQEKLKKGLNIVEKISSKSLTLPILNNILITIEKNFLKLSATDLEIGIEWWVLTKTEKEGMAVVPSRLFSSFINLLPNKKIDLELKSDNLFIECDNYKTKIKSFKIDEFPIIPKITKNEFISIKSASFCGALKQVVDIAVPSTTRPEISGVYFLFQKDLIIVTATDSFRLGEKKIFLKNKSALKENYSLIIPQKTIKEVINIFDEKEGDLNIYFSPNQIMFESLLEETPHPQVNLISRLIEGEYPNYKEIIPKKYTTRLTLKKDDFANQIKSASLFSGKVNEVRIKTGGDNKKIEILSQSPDLGEYQSFIMVSGMKGEPVNISFNHRFLLDGLSNIKSSEVVLELSGDSGPGVLRPVGDDSYLYVVMPIKAN
jgi:DNA polymerase-3 subunit beta